ncbi:hypothetical protein GF358_00825 [Candidatus Woesearchaeota archaeon]|nr:hypothetical protein [Candidatus Woesearchaeota archaeon]
MNKKAGMWALNFLVSVGLIAIILFGFFMLMSSLRPSDVSEVKTTVTGINKGSSLITFFRMSDVLDSPVECNELSDSLIDFYGKDVDYILKINGAHKCSKGDQDKNSVTIDFIMPDYRGNVYNITLEVSS